MKKICVGLLSLLILYGCKDETKTNKESLINQNNLFIQGEGVSEQITLDTKNTNYNFVAYGNGSEFSILFQSKEANPVQYGQITLDQATKHSSLDVLIRVADGINCPPLLVCTENTSYDLESKDGLNFIKINFKDAPNFFLKPKNTESSSIEFTRIPVLINGQFSVNAPINWPVFQTQRFPKYYAEGSFNFDGKAYDVSSIDSPSFQYENGELKSESISIHLKSSIDTLDLVITKRFAISDQYNNVLLNIYMENFISHVLAVPNETWQDEGNLIALDLNNVNLVDRNSSNLKTLNTNIKISRSYAKLILSRNKLSITPVDSSFITRTENDRKIYYISANINNEYAELQIIQELKGHVSVNFVIDGGDNLTCGDRSTACEGITFDEQRKNFTFNNVKLGSENLNGTVYFAGVL